MKSIILKITFLLAIIMAGGVVLAQTTQGTDFYVSFGDNNSQAAGKLNLQIKIVASKAAKVDYTFNLIGGKQSVNVAAGEVYTFSFGTSQNGFVYSNTNTGTTSPVSRSLYIHSDEPVSVYALNQYKASTDATNILPVNSLGTEYYHISYQPPYSTYNDGYTIVATEDATDIFENGTQLTTMNKGQVYSVYKTTDMTGSHITSTKPIALFTTHPVAMVPYNVTASDHLYQQMMPVNTWGKKYFVPVTHRGAERVRIVASQDGTNISHTGGTVISGSLTNLNKGQFVELEINLAEGGSYITSNKPVGVCSFLMGTTSTSLTYSVGDPAIALLPSVEQFVDSATISPFIPSGTTGSTLLTEHYALLFMRTSSIGKTTMCIGTGASTALSGGTWTTGANPDYSFYNLPLTNATQSCTFANPDGLAIMGYGLGQAESYYYLAASAFKDISATFFMNEEEYFDVDGKEYCNVSSLHIKAVIENESAAAGHLQWFIDGDLKVTDQPEWDLDLTSLSSGEHTVRMQVIDLNNQTKIYETKIRICVRSLVLQLIPVNPN
jgi:hypothetical protein